MRSTGVLGLVLAVLVSGCALDAGESGPAREAEPTADERSAFDASLFKFSVQVPDDHRGEGGGWQVASTVLSFSDWRSAWVIPDTWTCRVTIKVPIRHKSLGVISPEHAARMSAAAAVAASTKGMNQRPKWIAALFCPSFAAQIIAELSSLNLGARVSSP